MRTVKVAVSVTKITITIALGDVTVVIEVPINASAVELNAPLSF